MLDPRHMCQLSTSCCVARSSEENSNPPFNLRLVQHLYPVIVLLMTRETYLLILVLRSAVPHSQASISKKRQASARLASARWAAPIFSRLALVIAWTTNSFTTASTFEAYVLLDLAKNSAVHIKTQHGSGTESTLHLHLLVLLNSINLLGHVQAPVFS